MGHNKVSKKWKSNPITLYICKAHPRIISNGANTVFNQEVRGKLNISLYIVKYPCAKCFFWKVMNIIDHWKLVFCCWPHDKWTEKVGSVPPYFPHKKLFPCNSASHLKIPLKICCASSIERVNSRYKIS